MPPQKNLPLPVISRSPSSPTRRLRDVERLDGSRERTVLPWVAVMPSPLSDITPFVGVVGARLLTIAYVPFAREHVKAIGMRWKMDLFLACGEQDEAHGR